MDTGHVSCDALASDLLAHFDLPAEPSRDAVRRVPTRGIGWVLLWASALAILLLAGTKVLELCYHMTAELALSRAAKAAVFEATLPQATTQSVREVVLRRLAETSLPVADLRITVWRNGAPVRGALCPAENDQLSVTLSLPTAASLPEWLNTVGRKTDAPIEARAKRRIPGRNLPVARR